MYLEGFNTILDQDIEKIQYLNKGFDKGDVYFLSIESSYRKYKSFFFLKSWLYKHWKNEYTLFIYFYLLNASTTPLTVLIPMVTIKSMVLVMRSGLVFWVWIYANMTIILVFWIQSLVSKINIIACLNTHYSIILINKAWLWEQLLNQKIKEMSTFLKIKKIEASKHKSAKFAKFFFSS